MEDSGKNYHIFIFNITEIFLKHTTQIYINCFLGFYIYLCTLNLCVCVCVCVCVCINNVKKHA